MLVSKLTGQAEVTVPVLTPAPGKQQVLNKYPLNEFSPGPSIWQLFLYLS